MSAHALLLLLVPLAEPLDDRTVAALVADLKSTDAGKQFAAHAALVKAGPHAKSAVPDLIKMLEDKTQRYDYAADVLGAIGPGAKAAVPALLARLPKEPGQFGFGSEHLAAALAKIDGPKIEATRVLLLATLKGGGIYLQSSGTLHAYTPEVVKHLITLCADPDKVVRQKAATVLAALKVREPAKVKLPTLYEKAGDSVKALPAALEKLLTDPDTEVRVAGATAITHVCPELTDKALTAMIDVAKSWEPTKKGEFNAHEVFRPVPDKAAKVLIPLFDHEKDRVRYFAINHIYHLPVLAELVGVLKDGKTARAREAAAVALGNRYSDGHECVPALKAALADVAFPVRFAAAVGLVNVARNDNPARAAAVPVLVEGVRDRTDAVRRMAASYLLQLGPLAKSAVPDLKALLDDKTQEVQLEAALALVGIDPKEGAAAVPVLTHALTTGDGPAHRAARALAKLGPVAKAAGPALEKHFGAKNLNLRVAAAEAAARVDAALAPKAVEVIVAILKEAKPRPASARMYAIESLRAIGAPAKPALPLLADMLNEKGEYPVQAAVAMVVIDADGAKAAFDWMRAVFAKPGHDDAYELAEALPELGPKAAPLVPELLKLLGEKQLYFRRAAIATLGAIGPAAKDALPDLKKMVASDPRPDLKKLAAAAVAKIEAK
jgi:HEAT repeat protein